MKLGQTGWPKFMLRLPPDLKAWIAEQAEKHGNSQNAEIVRAVRERAERAQTTQPAT